MRRAAKSFADHRQVAFQFRDVDLPFLRDVRQRPREMRNVLSRSLAGAFFGEVAFSLEVVNTREQFRLMLASAFFNSASDHT